MYQGYDERTGKMLPFQKAKLLIDYLFELWKEQYLLNRIYGYRQLF
jgi:hypothetical protein